MPAHSRDVCPWGTTCPAHAQPTFGEQAQRRLEKRLKACGKCGGRRTVAGLRGYERGTGLDVPVCVACHRLSALPKFLRQRAVAA